VTGFSSRGDGVHVGISNCKKSSAEAAVVMAADKCQEVAMRRHVFLPMPTFVRLIRVCQKSLFLSKKVANRYKRIEDY
jgi:hypothetical protein